MHWAFATTIFFSLSAILARRSSQALGATQANLGRVLVAGALLAGFAHGWGGGLSGPGLGLFLVSGIIGVGIGDLGLFAALPLIGSRLSILIMQCLAAPIAIFCEWSFLETSLTAQQLGLSAVVLAGIALALIPSAANPAKVEIKPIGFFYAVIAAAGQGIGAVISRKGSLVNEAAGEHLDKFTMGYQRVLGGLACTLAAFALTSAWKKLRAHSAAWGGNGSPATSAPYTPTLTWHACRWVPLNALCGPILGIAFYQQALATTPSGLVLSIVACTPIAIIPLAYWLEGERPSGRSLIGGVIAVGGAVALALSR